MHSDVICVDQPSHYRGHLLLALVLLLGGSRGRQARPAFREAHSDEPASAPNRAEP
jgi:hypothetical protein